MGYLTQKLTQYSEGTMLHHGMGYCVGVILLCVIAGGLLNGAYAAYGLVTKALILVAAIVLLGFTSLYELSIYVCHIWQLVKWAAKLLF